MDPLSIAASVAGLLAASSKLVGLLRQITAFRDAPDSAKIVLTEMTSMSAALTQLQGFLQGVISSPTENRRFISLDHVVVTLTGCVTTYSELEGILDSLNLQDMTVIHRLRWLRRESAILDIIGRLQNQKASLTLMLTILQCTSQRDMESSMFRLCDLVGEAIRSNRDLLARLNRVEQQNLLDNEGVRGGSQVGSGERRDTAKQTNELSIPVSEVDPSNNQSSMDHSPFEEVLRTSRVYQRRSPDHSRSSLARLDPRADAASILSTQSLADVSNIQQVRLPVTATDITNSQWYAFGRNNQEARNSEEFQVCVKTMTGKIKKISVTPYITCLELKQCCTKAKGAVL